MEPAVRGLKIAPVLERSATTTPLFLSTAGFQATSVPSSVEKISVAGALLPCCLMTKSRVALKTLPLGAEGGLAPFGEGMVIGDPTTRPAASYSVATPEWLSATRNWPSGVWAMPQ